MEADPQTHRFILVLEHVLTQLCLHYVYTIIILSFVEFPNNLKWKSSFDKISRIKITKTEKNSQVHEHMISFFLFQWNHENLFYLTKMEPTCRLIKNKCVCETTGGHRVKVTRQQMSESV